MAKTRSIFHTHEMLEYLMESKIFRDAILKDLNVAKITKLDLEKIHYELIAYWVSSIKDLLYSNESKEIFIEDYSFEKLEILKLLGDYPGIYKTLDDLLIKIFKDIQGNKYFEPIGFIYIEGRNMRIVPVDQQDVC